MATTRNATSAGFRRLSWSKLDASGNNIGTGTTAPVAGNQTGARFTALVGALTLPSGTPEDTIVDVPGDDDDALASFNFPSGQSPRGTLEVSYSDIDFDAYVQNVLIENVAGTDWAWIPEQAEGRNSVPISLLAQRRAVKGDPDNKGNQAWEVKYLLRTNVTPQGNAYQSRANSPFQYSLTVGKSGAKPWGVTMSEVLNGTLAGGQFRTYSDNPIEHAVYTGDGTEVAFTLPYPPISTTGKILVSVNATLLAITTNYTVSGSVVTFGAPPANNANIQIMYEKDEMYLE
jgi:hypothetical protein